MVLDKRTLQCVLERINEPQMNCVELAHWITQLLNDMDHNQPYIQQAGILYANGYTLAALFKLVDFGMTMTAAQQYIDNNFLTQSKIETDESNNTRGQ